MNILRITLTMPIWVPLALLSLLLLHFDRQSGVWLALFALWISGCRIFEDSDYDRYGC